MVRRSSSQWGRRNSRAPLNGRSLWKRLDRLGENPPLHQRHHGRDRLAGKLNSITSTMCAEDAAAPPRGGKLLQFPVGRSTSLSLTAGEGCSQEIGRFAASNLECPERKGEDASEGRSAPPKAGF